MQDGDKPDYLTWIAYGLTLLNVAIWLWVLGNWAKTFQ
jgi:hypothetical protein